VGEALLQRVGELRKDADVVAITDRGDLILLMALLM
jgi:hypothetical protein